MAKNGGPGRGQEEFYGDFTDALRYAYEVRKREASRRQQADEWAKSRRGPMRPFRVHWQILAIEDGAVRVSMTSKVIASSEKACLQRAPWRYTQEAGLRSCRGFRIQKVQELK